MLGRPGMRGASILPVSLLAVACATYPQAQPAGRTPGLAEPAIIRIERTGAYETEPETLHVPPGTAVTWQNRTTRFAWVRFDDPVPEVCGAPVRFSRSTDRRSFTSDVLGPFEEATLCIMSPGRYDFIVSIPGGSGDGGLLRGSPPPAKYGTLVVTP